VNVHLSSRVPGFLLLGLVVLAAGLLIAGYGAAVGAGLIAGMLLGLAVMLALLAMRPQTSGGSSYWFGSSTTSPSMPPGQELIQRHHQDWMRVAGVDASALRRVIAVGAEVEAGGARVELVAVEIREDGGVSTLVAHTRPPVGQPGHFVDVAVADEAGTAYVAAGQGSMSGGSGTSRYDVRFAPTPPSAARFLTIRIGAFDSPFPVPEQRVEGPWEFRIPL
jgi:hypothetical protein